MSAILIDEENALFDVFGDTARVRIISFFLSNPDQPYKPTEIAHKSGLSRSSWYDNNNGEELHEAEVVIKIDDTPKYQLNRENQLVSLLLAIHQLDA